MVLEFSTPGLRLLHVPYDSLPHNTNTPCTLSGTEERERELTRLANYVITIESSLHNRVPRLELDRIKDTKN